MAALAFLSRWVSDGCAAAILTSKSLDPPALELLGKMTFGDDRTKHERILWHVGGGGGAVVASVFSVVLLISEKVGARRYQGLSLSREH